MATTKPIAPVSSLALRYIARAALLFKTATEIGRLFSRFRGPESKTRAGRGRATDPWLLLALRDTAPPPEYVRK